MIILLFSRFLLRRTSFFPLFLLWVCPNLTFFLLFYCSGHSFFLYFYFWYAPTLAFSLFFATRGILFSFISIFGMPRHWHFPCFLLLGAFFFPLFLALVCPGSVKFLVFCCSGHSFFLYFYFWYALDYFFIAFSGHFKKKIAQTIPHWNDLSYF